MKRDMPNCGGCRTCERACSFHHTGEYNPSLSSIRILEKENEAGFLVLLLEEDGTDGFACDGCLGLDHPLCLQVCREGDDLGRILTEFAGFAPSVRGGNEIGGPNP
jgi:Fe-S-cluster-containing hydrogenase component 2